MFFFSKDQFFNVKFRDKIATGSFDKTACIWSTERGTCYHTLRGHTGEIVCLAFNPQSTVLVTGSMDHTAKLWDIVSGTEIASLHVSYLCWEYFDFYGSIILQFRVIQVKLYLLVLIHEVIKL